ncbi:hypothetical protein HW115_14460 [Verrucomicrobiaceae bacterium N1E253]|uniref:Sulfotransferase family protein n=1 Tax=Oceaniferula marina TaxID=2748318 RepID=A0A851GIP7_9BACT|nr:sulfotransferase [Oceaniferula marina]NWK56822.1 hypothetical protein [Oceaniferula marina]
MKKRTKVFCIGYNKTGTTTVEKVLKKMGYVMPKQTMQERLISEDVFRGDYRSLRKLCKKYDAFQDMPFSQGSAYIAADALFPGSQFILTVRDADAWFDSLVRFHLKGIMKRAGVEKIEDFNENSFKDKEVYLHKNYSYQVVRRHAVTVENHAVHYDWSLVYNKEHRVSLYEERNRQILEYFQNRPEQLLVFDVEKESNNSRMVEFLGLPSSFIEDLPHLNQSRLR